MSAPKRERETTTTAGHRWLSLIGVGEDGASGLNPTAHGLIEAAQFVVGGERHLALVQNLIANGATRLAWPSPITDGIEQIAAQRGRNVVVLATGNPFHYGVGTLLTRHFAIDEIICIPQPSAFSLAAARLGWPLQDTALITLHGRALEGLNRHLYPGARILALSWDGNTPQNVARALSKRGLGEARITVLGRLGGPREHFRTCSARDCNFTDVTDLNTLAIELPAAADAASSVHGFARIATGIDDDAFEHDGQITKREIRTITIAALDPRPGEHLWDIGLGAGSVAIEWLLCHRSLRATGFERDTTRAARVLSNAARLGAPELEVVTGTAPEALRGCPPPDAVFIGGGLSIDGVFDAAWSALKPNGRLVANAVTLETQAKLTDLQAQHGGELIKVEIAKAGKVGRMRGWRTAMPVVQWRVQKT